IILTKKEIGPSLNTQKRVQRKLTLSPFSFYTICIAIFRLNLLICRCRYAVRIIDMVHFVKKYRLAIFGIALGAIGGFLYWHFVGCNSGTCAITSKPVNSTLYGSVMGGLLFSMFRKEKEKENEI